MLNILNAITPEQIYRYGSWVFVFWVAQFLIRKVWGLFEGRVKDIHADVECNKQQIESVVKISKDVSVIQAHMLDKLQKHDDNMREGWTKMFVIMDKLLGFVNGNNPKVVEMQKEIDSIKKYLEERK